MTHSRRHFAFITSSVAIAVAGCHAILGLDDPTIEDGAALTDASDDALQVLGPTTDGADPSDAGLDADGDAEPEVVVTYNEQWDNPTLWNKLNLKELNAGTTSFVGAVFDGRYIYFAPSNNTTSPAFAARYDTKGNGFTVNDSWKFFDTAILHPDARGFEGAFFDGRYVYFVPFAGPTVHTGRFTRFDTKADRDFNDAQAWSTFDTTTLNQYAKGFIGAAFDGTRYAYAAPGIGNFPETGTRPQALAARFDTSQAATGFASAGAWQFFDTQTVAPQLDAGGPRGFVGAVYTGTHVYFVPYGYAVDLRGRVIRHETAKPFQSPSSWEVFDTLAIDPGAAGFQGGAYDGRYVYLTPLLNESGQHGTVTRFDTQKPFTAASSWTAFDIATIDGGGVPSQEGRTPIKVGFVGAGFDGRFVYFSGNQSPAIHGWIARFDSARTLPRSP